MVLDFHACRGSHMLKYGIILALAAIAVPAHAQKSRDTGRGGVSCTYEKCMDNCNRLGGKFCSNYCEKTLKERRQSGVCKQ